MKKKGFTLIEMIVVITVVALVVPAIFSIIFGLIRQHTKIHRLSTAKTEGDLILNLAANTIRNNAITIHSSTPPNDVNMVCAGVGDNSQAPLYFQDRMGEWFGFSLSSNTISSESSNLASPVALNSTNTTISDFVLSCTKSNLYSAPVVSFSFKICYGACTSTRTEETVELNYQTKIKLRNF